MKTGQVGTTSSSSHASVVSALSNRKKGGRRGGGNQAGLPKARKRGAGGVIEVMVGRLVVKKFVPKLVRIAEEDEEVERL